MMKITACLTRKRKQRPMRFWLNSKRAKAQQTLLRGKMESLARELATCRSEQESREQRESAREEEGNRLQTQLREKEEENVALRAKQSSLTMAMTGLVEKVGYLGR